MAWIAAIARVGLPYWHLVPPLLLAGCGVSVAIPATMSAVMTAVPPAAIGQASGTLNTLRQLGGVFGVAICAAVFAARGHYASPATFVAGFGPAMAACATGPARRRGRSGHPRPQASTRVSRCRPASPESRTEDRDQEITMSQSIIRYRTKPDQADANAELVRAVYAELHRTRPDGFRYTTLRLDDQVTFVHITQSERDPSPILEIKAFGEFQAGIRDRCDEPPVAQAFTEVGSYRFLTG